MLYFAYGMNTDPSYMQNATPVGRARLRGWRFDFRVYADVQPERTGVVEGVLWRIDGGTLAGLDRREGYPRMYDRSTVKVEVLNDAGERDYVTSAVVYHLQPAWQRIVPPDEGYLAICRRGYAAFGIPQDQLDAALAVSQQEGAAR